MFKQIAIGTALVVITLVINQLMTPLFNEELQYIDHFQRQSDASLSLSELPGNKFKMFNNNKPIDNLSMTHLYVAKRNGKHLKNIRLTFKVKEQSNKITPNMISAELSGPEGYDKSGIQRVELKEPHTIAFDISSFNVSDNFSDGFAATFAFNSKYAPEMEMKTTTLGVKPKLFDPEEESLNLLILAIAISIPLAIGFFYFIGKQEHKERLRKLDRIKDGFIEYLESTPDASLSSEQSTTICEKLITIYKNNTWPKKDLNN